jgi:hypothetical protein
VGAGRSCGAPADVDRPGPLRAVGLGGAGKLVVGDMTHVSRSGCGCGGCSGGVESEGPSPMALAFGAKSMVGSISAAPTRKLWDPDEGVPGFRPGDPGLMAVRGGVTGKSVLGFLPGDARLRRSGGSGKAVMGLMPGGRGETATDERFDENSLHAGLDRWFPFSYYARCKPECECGASAQECGIAETRRPRASDRTGICWICQAAWRAAFEERRLCSGGPGGTLVTVQCFPHSVFEGSCSCYIYCTGVATVTASTIESCHRGEVAP